MQQVTFKSNITHININIILWPISKSIHSEL